MMLEFLAAHGRVRVLVSPGLTLLVLPADHQLPLRPLRGLQETRVANRIAEVELFWSCIQLMIDVGVLGCSWETLGPGQPRASLENPRDGGAWWAAVYGVAQSRTRLK